MAAYKGHIEVVRILLKAGCDLDIQDDVSRFISVSCVGSHFSATAVLIGGYQWIASLFAFTSDDFFLTQR